MLILIQLSNIQQPSTEHGYVTQKLEITTLFFQSPKYLPIGICGSPKPGQQVSYNTLGMLWQ